jgi:DNA-binding response OmpR family regulator
VEGFTVQTAASGEQAFPVIDSFLPDAIVLDIMLPGMDGFEILRRLHANETYKSIPVFMLSNKAWPDDINLALTLGAHSFHTKGSATPQKIVADIRSVCGLKQAMIISVNTASAKPITDRLQHPRLLCAVNLILAEAFSAVQRSNPDVLILDVAGMGGMFHVILQQLKQATTTQAIPVVAITMETPKVQRADVYVTSAQLDDILRPTVLQLTSLTDPSTAPILAPVAV